MRVVAASPGHLARCPDVDEHVTCARDPQRAASHVGELAATSAFDWVVVADEVLLAALATRRGPIDIAPWAPFDLSNPQIARFLLSKHGFVELAGRLGIPIPPSRLVDDVERAVAFASDLDYPVVVRGDRGFAGIEVAIASDEVSLRRSVAATLATYGKAAVQQYVRGSTVSVSVVYAGGIPLALKAYRTTCGFPTPTSASTRHDHFDHPGIEPIVRRIGAYAAFDGLAGIDFMHDPATDDLFAIEVNPRPTLGFTGAQANRAFFAPALRRFMNGAREPLVLYDGPERVQTYFPSHLFFGLVHPEQTDARALLAALGDCRARDWRLVAWEVARFFKDRLALAARAFVPADESRDVFFARAPRSERATHEAVASTVAV